MSGAREAPGSTWSSAAAESERVHDDDEVSIALGSDIEAHLATRVLGVTREPGLAGPGEPPHLFGGHHLEGISEPAIAFRLHLAEDDGSAATDDEVELIATDPDVRSENPVAAQAVVPERTALGLSADRAGATPRRAGLGLLLR